MQGRASKVIGNLFNKKSSHRASCSPGPIEKRDGNEVILRACFSSFIPRIRCRFFITKIASRVNVWDRSTDCAHNFPFNIHLLHWQHETFLYSKTTYHCSDGIKCLRSFLQLFLGGRQVGRYRSNVVLFVSVRSRPFFGCTIKLSKKVPTWV